MDPVVPHDPRHSNPTADEIEMLHPNPAAQASTRAISALATLYTSNRKRPYPLYRLRRWIYSFVASCCLLEEPNFDCAVQFAVIFNNQEEPVHRLAGGMLDTGLHRSFLSRDYFEKHLEPLGVHVKEFSDGPQSIFRTVDGTVVKSVGTVRMRFRVVGDTKFIEAPFYVSHLPIAGFQVLIGEDILKEHWRLVPVGAPGSREPPPRQVSQDERDKAAKEKNATSSSDRRLKRMIREEQRRNGTTSRQLDTTPHEPC